MHFSEISYEMYFYLFLRLNLVEEFCSMISYLIINCGITVIVVHRDVLSLLNKLNPLILNMKTDALTYTVLIMNDFSISV